MLEEIIAQVERILRIGLTIITAYLVALWIASIWWTFRDIRSRTTDLFLQVAATLLVTVFSFAGLLIYIILRPTKTLVAVVRGVAGGGSVPPGHPGPERLPGLQAARRAGLHLLPLVPDAPEAGLRSLRAADDAALEGVPVLRPGGPGASRRGRVDDRHGRAADADRPPLAASRGSRTQREAPRSAAPSVFYQTRRQASACSVCLSKTCIFSVSKTDVDVLPGVELRPRRHPAR